MIKETNLLKQGFEDITKLNGFHNDVFKGSYEGRDIIIRRTKEKTDYKLNQLTEEISVLNQIKENVPVGEPLKVNGNYILETKNHFYVFFKHIPGKNWHELKHDQTTYFKAGELLAKIHKNLNNLKRRADRSSYEHHPDIKLINELDQFIQDEIENTLHQLRSYIETKNTFGLIHGDYLFSNLIYQEEKLVAIDFDDIEYNFYMYDIAVYLFYYLLGGDPSSMDQKSNKELFIHFMKGYRSIYTGIELDFSLLKPLFRLRQLKLYATIKTYIKEEDLGAWQQSYLEMTESQIRNEEPFCSIQYESLYNKTEK